MDRRDSSDEAAEAKRKLEALFSGGKAPAAPTNNNIRPVAQPQKTPSGRVFAAPRKSTGRSPTEYRMRLERLRMAREPADLKEAVDAYLKHHQLPDDPDILYRVLRHPSEQVVRDALGQLSSLLMQGRLGSTMLLEDHLRELAERATEEATHSYVEGLRHQLDALKARQA